MWKSISRVLAEQLGAFYHIRNKIQITHGKVHETWLIDDGHTPVFVKINNRSYRSMFRAEADQLQLLAKSKSLRIPMVYGMGCSTAHSFLLLEGLSLEPFSIEHTESFAVRLAALHLWQEQDKYGLDFDTWLGLVHQPNNWSDNWANFFSENRIGWQLQLCKEKGFEFAPIDEIIQTIKQRLYKHQPKPALLHGDLVNDNYGVVQNDITVFDPACYWGDHECDLACLELFNPLSDEFFAAYDKLNPIDNQYSMRKPVYQLYYLLYLTALLGEGKYQQHAQEIIDNLLEN